jgi:ABC-type nickel/cobalt efflux system permease component RcnA
MQIMTPPSPRARHKDWTRTAVLLAMGVYLTFLLISGNLSNYMNSNFHWLVGVAAGLFFLLGGWNLWLVWRRADETHTLGRQPEHQPRGPHAHPSQLVGDRDCLTAAGLRVACAQPPTWAQTPCTA